MDVLEARVDAAWEACLQRFFHPGTLLFYDYLTSRDPARALAHLPDPDEVRHAVPNVCGWGTGMEDSAINGGTLLSMLCDRHEARPSLEDGEQARRVYRGLARLATVHGVPGFVARSICPADGRSVYPNSSRDQYTHFVHGLWRYFGSDLSTPDERDEIRRLLVEVAVYAERCAVPEHDWTMLDLHGRRAICSKLWNVAPHEAARLPMFYAAAWSVSDDEHWRAQCLHYLDAALEQSMQFDQNMLAYPKLQMQASLELLRDCGILTAGQANACAAVMRLVAGSVEPNSDVARDLARQADLYALFPNWRARVRYESNGVLVPDVLWGDFKPTFLSVREIGEAALADLMTADQPPRPRTMENLVALTVEIDPERHAGYGLFYLIAAYWRARRRGLVLAAESGAETEA